MEPHDPQHHLQVENGRETMTKEKISFSINRRRTLMLMGAAGMTTFAPGLAGLGFAEAQEAPKGQVVVGFSQEPTVFNPHLPHIEVDEGIHYAIFDPLFDVDPQGKFYPLLAKEVPTVENGGISPDGLKDRKSTRLNSSHVKSSYAVFCLKK